MQKPAATNTRNFRSFLLMQQFAAQEIGLRIAQARKERGLTQEQLAELSSFSKRSLQDYEGGVTIPYKHLQELGRLLSRETAWFLYGDPEPTEAGAAGDEEARWEQVLLRLRRIEEALSIPQDDPAVPQPGRAANGQ